jgi:hypothetical protein
MTSASHLKTSLRVVPLAAFCLALLLGPARPAPAEDDPYWHYVRTAPEFQPVRQDPELLIGRWDTWIYMPWRYRWSIGTGDEGGRFCADFGINGGFTDHGYGPLDWLEKWNLRFYNDHTAAKGYLKLREMNRSKLRRYQHDGYRVRRDREGAKPLDDAMLDKLRGLVRKRVGNIKESPLRVAYALDDEISSGVFVRPISWRLNEDDAAYARWLRFYYGTQDAPEPQYVTPDFTRAQLGRPLDQLDFSPLLDRLTYNDSLWANFLGELVECANEVDPTTPCGFVGGQSPSTWGGYDYAKLMRKVQFIESYDIGSSAEVIRSLSPHNAMPIVTTHFHKDSLGSANDVWQAWYYFAHGNRGMIGWIEGWFDGRQPRPWLDEFKPALKEIGGKQGPKLVGARWLHDGVAIYYSQPSIQVSWVLDAEAHGRKWSSRGDDHRLGTSHLTRKAWEYLLADSGIQYNFVTYDRVVADGVPEEYKVLILPACYALSDVEARRIAEFCRHGGTVIADFACGIFDHHGRGRTRGALDDLFGVEHDGTETAADFFAKRFWVETDQDRGFRYDAYRELFDTLDCTLHEGFAVAERRLPIARVEKQGQGTAVYLNLSPQRYLQYREEGTATDSQRDLFVRHVTAAGAAARAKVTGPDGHRPAKCEVTYWHNGDRVYMFVLQNARMTGNSLGNEGAAGLESRVIPITVELAAPVKDALDERTGRRLGDGRTFRFDFNMVEAVFFSFASEP